MNSLRCMIDLRVLDIGGNAFHATATHALAAALTSLSRLTELGFSRNTVGPRGMAHLCDALPALPQLTVLDLCGSEVGAEEEVHKLLELLPQLEWLGVRTQQGRWIALKQRSHQGYGNNVSRTAAPRRHQHLDGRSR